MPVTPQGQDPLRAGAEAGSRGPAAPAAVNLAELNPAAREAALVRAYREAGTLDALIELVAFYRSVGREDRARELLEGAAEREGDLELRARLLLSLGRSYERSAEYDAAAAWYRAAMALEPEDPHTAYFVHNNLAFCLNLQGAHEEAEELCELAIAIRPGRASAHKNLGISLAAQGRELEAASAWITAMMANPRDGRALGLLEGLLATHPHLLAAELEDGSSLGDAFRDCRAAFLAVTPVQVRPGQGSEEEPDRWPRGPWADDGGTGDEAGARGGDEPGEYDRDADLDSKIDPWKGLTSAQFQAALDALLEEDPDALPVSGRVFRARKLPHDVMGWPHDLSAVPFPDPPSLAQVFLGLVRGGDREWEAACERFWNEGWVEYVETKLLPRFARGRSRPVITCQVTNSMTSGWWGLRQFRVGDRGYFYMIPDWGSGTDYEHAVVGAWEPYGDRATRHACLRSVYLRCWDKNGMPPMMGEWVQGDRRFLWRVVLEIVERRPDAWDLIADHLRYLREWERRCSPPPASGAAPAEPDPDFEERLRATARLCRVPLRRVRALLAGVHGDDHPVYDADRLRAATREERWVAVAYFIVWISS